MAEGDPVRIIPHSPKGIPDAGSYEVRYVDGRESVYFRWDENAGRRSISMTSKTTKAEALKAAMALARKG